MSETATSAQTAATLKVDAKANGALQKPSITVSDLDASKVSPRSDSDSEEEPPQISSEQLLRRASFKKILEDLSSSADAINKPAIGDPLVSAAAATVQAQAAQQALLQQASLGNPALLPLLQNLQQSANNTNSSDLSQQIAAMILPGQLNAQQQLQLQSALLNSAAHQSPFLTGQGLSNNVLQSALLNAAASNAALSNLSSQLASAGSLPTLSKLSTATSLVGSSGSNVSSDDTTRKREVRLMKNREAARECRRKKKEYIRCLENRVAVLESQNQALIGELRALKDLYLPKNQE